MLIALNDALFKHLSDTRQFGAVARKNKDRDNVHDWIPRLAIKGLVYDDYV